MGKSNLKKTQRLLATAMTPLLILQCLLTPLSAWADSLLVQPESTDYSNSAASSSEDESFVLNDEQQGVEVEQPTVSDNDPPSSVSSESVSNATDSPNLKMMYPLSLALFHTRLMYRILAGKLPFQME